MTPECENEKAASRLKPLGRQENTMLQRREKGGEAVAPPGRSKGHLDLKGNLDRLSF